MRQRNQTTLASRQLPPSFVLKRIQDIHDAIARRAYELFASRGFSHGNDLKDLVHSRIRVLAIGSLVGASMIISGISRMMFSLAAGKLSAAVAA